MCKKIPCEIHIFFSVNINMFCIKDPLAFHAGGVVASPPRRAAPRERPAWRWRIAKWRRSRRPGKRRCCCWRRWTDAELRCVGMCCSRGFYSFLLVNDSGMLFSKLFATEIAKPLSIRCLVWFRISGMFF